MISRLGIFAVSAAVTCVFLIDFCGWIYQCGCVSHWAGGAAQCNIHFPYARHCPWCSIGKTGFTAVTLAIVAVQAGVSFAPWGLPSLVRLLLSMAAFPVVGALLAGAIGYWTGYWRSG